MADDLFPLPVNPFAERYGFTVEQLAATIARELKYRASVYPRLVASHKMTPEKADEEFKRMRAVGELLNDLTTRSIVSAPKPEAVPVLFVLAKQAGRTADEFRHAFTANEGDKLYNETRADEWEQTAAWLRKVSGHE